MARSDPSPSFMPALRLSPFPAGLAFLLPVNDEVSRFSCMWFLSVPGVYDYVGSKRTRGVYVHSGVAFPFCPQGRHPNCFFRSSIPCPPMPLFTLQAPPHDDTSKTRGQDGSLLLSCETLSFSTTCRFIPALGQPALSARFRRRTSCYGGQVAWDSVASPRAGALAGSASN